MRYLKPGERLVWLAAIPAPFQPNRSNVRVLRQSLNRDRTHLERMGALLAAGAVRPPAITRHKLADAVEAHRVNEGRHLRGLKQFCGVERCMARKARAQRNHIGWAIRVFLRLEHH